MDNTLTQGAILLASLYAGILMGALYDICYMIRHLRSSKILDAVMDTLFWAGAFVIAAATLLRANGLQFRLFALAGFAIGFIMYKFTLGVLVVKLYHWIQKGISALFTRLMKSIK